MSDSRPDRLNVRDRSSGRMRRALRIAREYGVLGILRLVRQHGLHASAQFVLRNVRHSIAARVARRFDKKHGVDTGGSIQLDYLTVIGPNRLLGTEAVCTSPNSFAWMMRSLPPDLSSFTFIDVGAGKGRTLLLATHYGFRRIIGVEFARELAETARVNAKAYRPGAGSNIEVVEADGSSYEFPAEPLVVYFYNPFGKELLQRTLDNLVSSLRRSGAKAYIIYASSSHNTCSWARPLILELGAFREIPREPMPLFWDAVRTIEFASFETL